VTSSAMRDAAVAGDEARIPRAGEEGRVERAWSVLEGVLDPEVPVLSVCDLGIVRDVQARAAGGLSVVLTPTYSGCPATEVIADGVRAALEHARLGPIAIETRFAPAWTTDWISAQGREKLLAYGIAPPAGNARAASAEVGGHVTDVAPLRFTPRRVSPPEAALACPRCESTDSERLSAFGSTACKALWRCRACGEPFEHFKPI
jgi:ring-1,2-phenylacetyl-CoA epoxidase subunit PaaD